MRLENKVCIVTGSCKGIGAAIVERFLEEGAVCVVNSRFEKSVQETVQAWKEKGFDKVDGFACDVTDKNKVAEMMQYVYQKYGTIDVLVNNAGINKITSSYDLDPDDFRRVLDVDLVAPMICSQDYYVYLLDRRRCDRQHCLRIQPGLYLQARSLQLCQDRTVGADKRARRRVGGRRHPRHRRCARLAEDGYG